MILKVKKSLAIILYTSIILLLISPTLSTQFGIPRLDTLLLPCFILFFIFFVFIYKLDKKVKYIVLTLFLLSLSGFLSIVLNYSFERLQDILYISFLIFLFYISYEYIKRTGFDSKYIRRLLSTILIIIYLGFFIEILFGIQLVLGSYLLSLESSAFKGLFFNTNDQATIVTMLTGAVCFFFLLEKRHKHAGYLHILASGIIVFISASRFAMLVYIFLILMALFLTSNKVLKSIYILIGVILSTVLVNLNFIRPVLSFLAQFPFLERSVQRFELAIFSLDEDNSIGYRTEIYQSFLDNFSTIWIGYGPRNYYAYFSSKPLSYSLGYTNPHSFFIEVYMAFGIFGFMSVIIFLFYSLYKVLLKSNLHKYEKILFFTIVIAFCCIVWVPSSIFRLPLIWYPIFLVIIYSTRPSLSGNKNA